MTNVFDITHAKNDGIYCLVKEHQLTGSDGSDTLSARHRVEGWFWTEVKPSVSIFRYRGERLTSVLFVPQHHLLHELSPLLFLFYIPIRASASLSPSSLPQLLPCTAPSQQLPSWIPTCHAHLVNPAPPGCSHPSALLLYQ